MGLRGLLWAAVITVIKQAQLKPGQCYILDARLHTQTMIELLLAGIFFISQK